MAPPDAYDIHDAQYIQHLVATAGAAALSTSIGPVPKGKVWTVLNAFAYCSAAETQVYWFAVGNPAGAVYPLTPPASVSIDPATSRFYPMLTEGMEFKVHEDERLYVYRAAATAGSTIGIYARFIETDRQYFVELDKHKVLRRRQEAMVASEPIQRGGLGGRFGSRGPFTRERPTRY